MNKFIINSEWSVKSGELSILYLLLFTENFGQKADFESCSQKQLHSSLSTLHSAEKEYKNMALDGAFLRQIKKELEENLINSKVDKIYQPSKDEIILFMRSRDNIIFSRKSESPPYAVYAFEKKAFGCKAS